MQRYTNGYGPLSAMMQGGPQGLSRPIYIMLKDVNYQTFFL